MFTHLKQLIKSYAHSLQQLSVERPRRAKRKHGFETLEARLALVGSLTINNDLKFAIYTGDATANGVTITYLSATDTWQFNSTQAFDLTTITLGFVIPSPGVFVANSINNLSTSGITVNLGADNDVLEFKTNLAASALPAGVPISVDLSTGTTDKLVVGQGGGTIFTVNAAHTGSFGANKTFTNVNILAGGINTDTFNINSQIESIVALDGDDIININSTVTSVDGGADDDIISLSESGVVTGTISGGSENNGDTLKIERAAGARTTLKGTNSGITSTLAGTTPDIVNAFSEIEILEGGTGPDSFIVEEGARLESGLDGKGGADTLRIYEIPLATITPSNATDGNVTTSGGLRILDTGFTALLGYANIESTLAVPSISAVLAGTKLTITGTTEDDTIVLNSDGAGGIIVTSNHPINGLISPQTFNPVSSLQVETLKGVDNLTIDTSTLNLTLTSLTIDLGGDDDTLVLGALPAATTSATKLTVNGPMSINGGEGDDTVIENFTSVTTSRKTIDLGEGKNVYTLSNSDSATTQITSGGEVDKLTITNFTANQTSLFNTGAGKDEINVKYSYFKDHVAFSSGDDNDKVSLDTNKFDKSLSVDTGTGDDYLLFTSSISLTFVFLNTGAGNDSVQIGQYITAVSGNTPTAFGGSGNSVNSLQLIMEEGIDRAEIIANTIAAFYASLGNERDETSIIGNAFTSGLLDGGPDGLLLNNTGNQNLSVINAG